jgi:hypothetical protein
MMRVSDGVDEVRNKGLGEVTSRSIRRLETMMASSSEVRPMGREKSIGGPVLIQRGFVEVLFQKVIDIQRAIAGSKWPCCEQWEWINRHTPPRWTRFNHLDDCPPVANELWCPDGRIETTQTGYWHLQAGGR